jgi:hypothetical protein
MELIMPKKSKKKTAKKKSRKVDVLAKGKGSTAEKLLTARQRQAARLEEITGIKQNNKKKKKKRNG